MKLTIVHPCIGRAKQQGEYIRTWQMEPLGAATIAGLTPAGIDIAFYDDRLESIPYDEETDLVAISIETYTAKRAYQIASEFRSRSIPVVMGGFHATLQPDEVATYADATIIGEAEHVWERVLADAARGDLQKFYHHPGRADLSLTIPDRSIFEGKDYLDIGLVEAGRGCHFRCDFCAIHSYFGGTHKRRPVEHVIEEIRSIDRDLIFFVDDNITSSLEEGKKLFRALAELDVRWVSQASINVAFDRELLGLLRDSGCYGLLIGFETLDTNNLRKMNKLFNNMYDGFEGAIKNLREFGIRLYPTFIFGYPDDTQQSFTDTVAFAKKHRFLIASFNHLTAFPGTPLYKRLEENGELVYDRWWLDERYMYGDSPSNTASLSSDEIKALCIEARKSFYTIPSILRRAADRWNVRDAFSLKAFLITNLLFRKEVQQREGLPLGDRNHTIELMPAEHDDTRTWEQTIPQLIR